MRNKKLIIIPAVIAGLVGAGTIGLNSLNAKVNNSIELTPTEGLAVSISTGNQDLNWFQKSAAEITATITLTVTGATKTALESSTIGIATYDIALDGVTAPISINFAKNCVQATDSTTCTATGTNLAFLYKADATDLTSLVEAASTLGKATNNGFLNWSVNYKLNSVSVKDVQGNTGATTNLTKDNEFKLNIAAGNVALSVA